MMENLASLGMRLLEIMMSCDFVQRDVTSVLISFSVYPLVDKCR